MPRPGTEIVARQAVLRRRGRRLQLRELPVSGRGHGPCRDLPRALRRRRHGRVRRARPGRARRSSSSQPVVEICEASAHVAMMIGRAYSVVTTLQRSVPPIEDRLRLAGLSARCASVRANRMSTLEVDEDPAGPVRTIVAEARQAVEVDDAEVICLGCAGMAGLEEAITSELGVPVIDGVGAAVRLAEAVVGLGLKTSKVSTYASPDPKKIIAWPLVGLAARPAPGRRAAGGGATRRQRAAGCRATAASRPESRPRRALAGRQRAGGERRVVRRQGEPADPRPGRLRARPLRQPRRDRRRLGDQAPPRARPRLGARPARHAGHDHVGGRRHELLHRQPPASTAGSRPAGAKATRARRAQRPGRRLGEIVPRSPLRGDRHNMFPVSDPRRFTHVRLSVFPDGGVARLRVFGHVVPDPRGLDGSPSTSPARIRRPGRGQQRRLLHVGPDAQPARPGPDDGGGLGDAGGGATRVTTIAVLRLAAAGQRPAADHRHGSFQVQRVGRGRRLRLRPPGAPRRTRPPGCRCSGAPGCSRTPGTSSSSRADRRSPGHGSMPFPTAGCRGSGLIGTSTRPPGGGRATAGSTLCRPARPRMPVRRGASAGRGGARGRPASAAG